MNKKREKCMLVSNINQVKLKQGYYNNHKVTEKFDGSRCLWIPQTEGLLVGKVPFANISRKPRLATRLSTGLWTRAWCPIFAPDWWIERLKKSHDLQYGLDGELWTGYRDVEVCNSVVRQEEPDFRWERVKFLATGCIPLTMFADGIVGGVELKGVAKWLRERGMRYDWSYSNGLFVPILGKGCDMHKIYADILEHYGEGIVLRDTYLNYRCERSSGIVKMKPSRDDHATVIGFTAGKDANKGRLGALICMFLGQKFKLSGMTFDQRELNKTCSYYMDGEELSDDYDCLAIPRGSSIHFKYRELTKYGTPKEASFIELSEI